MSVTAPQGFEASGIASGIKISGDPDLALVCTTDHKPVSAAAVFTSNLAKAAPVLVSRAHLDQTSGKIAAVICTSGNANAQTGEAGKRAAERLCEVVAFEIGSKPEEVLVCQTGLIGVPFPIDHAEAGIPHLVDSLAGSDDAGRRAAVAMMTTDTVEKQVAIRGDGFTVGGMAKGAAMLAPDMATMLAVLTTDAASEPDVLSRILTKAVSASFNEMSVDGCCSTNDTVILLSSGLAEAVPEEKLTDAVVKACAALAEAMVDDAEGASKVARISVTGAASDTEAAQGARKIATSLLVKCSLNGADPYWGRVVSELGSAGISFDPDKVSVAYGGTIVCDEGVAVTHDADAVDAHLAGSHVEIECDLKLGSGTSSMLTCDLGHGYIDENRTTS
ncbi:MAG: bifunctional glutamate N-acetyltransferase/amino-acid acetyltransferase ArgJ [Acidimicrobiales bacterium]